MTGDNEMLSQTLAGSESKSTEKAGHDSHAFFLDILKLREQCPFPPDFDWEKAREEAMMEKYGCFLSGTRSEEADEIS